MADAPKPFRWSRFSASASKSKPKGKKPPRGKGKGGGNAWQRYVGGR
jgi:hypothetical protein